MGKGRRRLYIGGRVTVSVSTDQETVEEIKKLGVSYSEVFRLGWETYKKQHQIINNLAMQLLENELEYTIKKALAGEKCPIKKFSMLYANAVFNIEKRSIKIKVSPQEFLEWLERKYNTTIVER